MLTRSLPGGMLEMFFCLIAPNSGVLETCDRLAVTTEPSSPHGTKHLCFLVLRMRLADSSLIRQTETRNHRRGLRVR